ncbi:uncharacterized protein CBL_10062 [Carabus blaptoides fortunei]
MTSLYYIDIYLYYQLSLQYFGFHGCAATVISETWALSATHCVTGAEASYLTLRAGSSIRETGGSVHKIKRIIQHPKFNKYILDYDYALIEVADPFDLTQPGIETIALSVTDPAVGEIATISGWAENGQVMRMRNGMTHDMSLLRC